MFDKPGKINHHRQNPALTQPQTSNPLSSKNLSNGCDREWAKIYTTTQDPNATFGALFITFNIKGNPNKAHGYFKTINNQIIDEFDITKIE